MAFEIVRFSTAAFQGLGLKHILVNYNVFAAPTPALAKKTQILKAASLSTAGVPSKQAAGAKSPQPSATKTAHKKNVLPPRLAREEWPSIWLDQLKKTKPGLIAWTYWNLGNDLMQKNSSKDELARRENRRGIIKRLIQDLGLPAGTHTFWPLHLDAQSSPRPNPAAFWSGIAELGCRGVIIFGSEGARKVIPEGHLEPLMQIRIGGMFVWIVRELDTIEEAAFYTRMVTYLKTQLQTIVRK